MRDCLNLLAVLTASIAIYIGLFVFLADKPLTIGFIRDSFEIKRNYASQTTGPKAVIAAGSGALFGIRCATLEELLDRPCVNGAITGELGLQYSIDLAKRLVRRGDVLIMPLEFGFYGHSHEDIRKQSTHPYRVRHDLATIWQLPAITIAQALFQFNLKYLVGAVIETSLAKAGISRRFSSHNLTQNGDMRFHTRKNGQAFESFVETRPLDTPRTNTFKIGNGTRQVMSDLGKWAHDRGVHILGTLPTSFDDRPIDEAVVTQIARLYRDIGHRFFTIENRSQYPRHCFYDSAYHLNEFCQQTHTRKLAEILRPLIAGLPQK